MYTYIDRQKRMIHDRVQINLMLTCIELLIYNFLNYFLRIYLEKYFSGFLKVYLS